MIPALPTSSSASATLACLEAVETHSYLLGKHEPGKKYHSMDFVSMAENSCFKDL